ncbi:MAG: AAA family ATPase [Acidobacteria bacterium]|nr:AAA family ATPase [Acidobacteriota bacterium]MBS1865586.1 AAA family ATPase [Acidobacteriota bacterium]
MTRGLVIGKFYPPHLGHSHLIARAHEQVDQVIVLVCAKPDQKINGNVRASWLAQMFPEADVRVIEDTGRDDDSQFWANETMRVLGFAPDVVFTSESYGDAYARFLGCKHASVDPLRLSVPISAAKIREDIFAYWQFLPGCVRAALVPKVCVIGAESTGSTTLAKALANHYRTAWVPEFGRTHSEGRMYLPPGTAWTSEEFRFIADVQNQFEDSLAPQANHILICDTDSFATCIWQERYLGFQSAEVVALAENRRMDLYLLTDANIPFVQDGLRDGEHIRLKMHKRFIEEMTRLRKPFLLVTGSPEKRLSAAVNACEEILNRVKDLFR